MPLRCRPELLTVSEGGHSGFNDEIKTVEPVAWDEICSYVSCSMVSSFFPLFDGALVFHYAPPRGYGLMGVTTSCFFVALEWISLLFVTPVTEVFQLGSEAHRAAVAGPQSKAVVECVTLPIAQRGVAWGEFPSASALNPLDRMHFMWTTSPAALHVSSLLKPDDDPTLLQDRFLQLICCAALRDPVEDVSNPRFHELLMDYAGQLFRASGREVDSDALHIFCTCAGVQQRVSASTFVLLFLV